MNNLKKKIDQIAQDIIKNYQKYSFESRHYKKNKESLCAFYEKKQKNKKKYIGILRDNIHFPYFKMGTINSSHLFGIDEIIIFSFYWLKKRNFLNAADLGANIGLHSIILSKLGYRVKSYEPDTEHFEKLNSNIKSNSCTKINTYRKAVDSTDKNATYTKIINNTTGSFINKSKKKTFGPIRKYRVRCEKFKKILKWAHLLKIDVEGIEAKLFCSTKGKDWEEKVAIMEIGSKENAIKIFSHSKKEKIFLFSQKVKWAIATKFQDLPVTHNEGSVIISLNKKNPWL